MKLEKSESPITHLHFSFKHPIIKLCVKIVLGGGNRGYERFSRVWKVIDPTSPAPDFRLKEMLQDTASSISRSIGLGIGNTISRFTERYPKEHKPQRIRRQPVREKDYPSVHRDQKPFGFGWAENNDSPEAKKLREIRQYKSPILPH